MYITRIDNGADWAGSLVRKSDRLLTCRSGVQIPLGPVIGAVAKPGMATGSSGKIMMSNGSAEASRRGGR